MGIFLPNGSNIRSLEQILDKMASGNLSAETEPSYFQEKKQTRNLKKKDKKATRTYGANGIV
jgi:hypothetical protein